MPKTKIRNAQRIAELLSTDVADVEEYQSTTRTGTKMYQCGDGIYTVVKSQAEVTKLGGEWHQMARPDWYVDRFGAAHFIFRREATSPVELPKPAGVPVPTHTVGDWTFPGAAPRPIPTPADTPPIELPPNVRDLAMIHFMAALVGNPVPGPYTDNPMGAVMTAERLIDAWEKRRGIRAAERRANN